MWCTVDSDEIDEENNPDLIHDASCGWLHKNGNGWHTVAGSLVDETAAGTFELRKGSVPYTPADDYDPEDV